MKYNTDEFIEKYCHAVANNLSMEECSAVMGMSVDAIRSRRRYLTKHATLNIPLLQNERVNGWQRKLNKAIEERDRTNE